MKFIKNNKRRILSIFLLFVVLGTVIYFGSSVSADTTVKVVAGKYICFDPSNATYKNDYTPKFLNDNQCGSNQTYEAVKTINGKNAYCIQWEKKMNSMDYKKDNTWKSNTKNAIAAGYAIDLVESKYDNSSVAYFMTGATLNTFFRNIVGGEFKTASWGYASKNEAIGNYYAKIKEYKNSIIDLSNKLPKITISSSSSVLSLNDNWFFSSGITVSGLNATYGGGSNNIVSYKINAKASNGKDVKICNNLKGEGCKVNTIELSNVSGSKKYYIFVNKNDFGVNDSITFSVEGKNKSVYPSSVVYISTKDPSNSQKLLVRGENYTVSRSYRVEETFDIPSTTNHRIIARKVDEFGNKLSGVTLEIYKDDIKDKDNLLVSGETNSSGEVRYVSPTIIDDDDDFFKHDYYLVEKSGINGYVFDGQPNKFYIKGSSIKKETVMCYKTNDDGTTVVVDKEYCNFGNYEYKCQNTSTNEIKDLNADNNCMIGNNAETESAENVESNYNKVCYNTKNSIVVNDDYCNNKDAYIKLWNSNGDLTVKHVNRKNVVRISKKSTTGNEEVVGAELKVCTEEEYINNKANCVPAKTIDDIEMSWVSSETAHDIYGVPKGSYYIVEVTPPNGYIRATIATKFRIDNDGTVTKGDGSKITNEEFVNKNGAIVINNQLTSISISKQDMATSNELPGATISICLTTRDENDNVIIAEGRLSGECIEAVLADGTVATWVSTDKPKEIIGLKPGTYYLVEKKAPDNYSTAESILFTLKEDGSLVDKDGKSLADNKLVMKDAPIKEVKTGNLSTYVVIGIFVVVVALGIGSYYYLKNNKTVINATVKKIRKRRIHKK